MSIIMYDTKTVNTEHPPIDGIDDMPETDDEKALYLFPQIADKKKNKNTSIVFWMQMNHMWKQLLSVNKIIKDLNLNMGVHKLESTDMVVIGFHTNKHPDMTHASHYERILMSRLPADTPARLAID